MRSDSNSFTTSWLAARLGADPACIEARRRAGELFGVPSRPVAGRPFTINLPVTRSDTARKLIEAKITCNVQANGRKVRAKASIVRGVARCGLVVPRSALAVRGSMTVRSAGKSVTAWFAGAIDFGGGVEGGAASR